MSKFRSLFTEHLRTYTAEMYSQAHRDGSQGFRVMKVSFGQTAGVLLVLLYCHFRFEMPPKCCSLRFENIFHTVLTWSYLFQAFRKQIRCDQSEALLGSDCLAFVGQQHVHRTSYRLIFTARRHRTWRCFILSTLNHFKRFLLP